MTQLTKDEKLTGISVLSALSMLAGSLSWYVPDLFYMDGPTGSM